MVLRFSVTWLTSPYCIIWMEDLRYSVGGICHVKLWGPFLVSAYHKANGNDSRTIQWPFERGRGLDDATRVVWSRLMLFRLMRPILNVWNHGKSTRPSLVRGSELSICFSFFLHGISYLCPQNSNSKGWCSCLWGQGCLPKVACHAASYKAGIRNE